MYYISIAGASLGFSQDGAFFLLTGDWRDIIGSLPKIKLNFPMYWMSTLSELNSFEEFFTV